MSLPHFLFSNLSSLHQSEALIDFLMYFIMILDTVSSLSNDARIVCQGMYTVIDNLSVKERLR